MTVINYSAPPTCAKFMRSQSFGRVILGPVGSGKTTAALFELFRRACEQAPAADGYRYSRFALVRNTLKSLKDTVLKDVLSWLKDLADYRVSESTIYINFGDVRSEWILIPLETSDDQRRLLSMQLTGGWLSECVEMPLEIVSPLAGRLGRYPSGNRGTPSWFGWIADSNLCSEGSDWHKFLTNPPADVQVFIQPGGMDPEAENLEWLTQTDETIKLRLDVPEELEIRRAQGRTYYERFLRSNSPEWCKIYVNALWGDDPSGSAVFRDTFKRHFHVVKDLDPVPSFPLIVGLDFGRDPCAVVCQVDHRGRLLVLEEVVAEDIGLELQVERNLRPALMKDRYLGKSVAIIGDPSGRAKGSIYEESSFDALKRMGFAAFPAPTNDIDARIRAVEAFLLSQREGGPAMMIDGDRCPTIVRALDGGYRYGKTKSGIRKPSPEKNSYSHIADALQYACLAAHGGMVGYIGNRLGGRMRHRDRPRVSVAGWT